MKRRSMKRRTMKRRTMKRGGSSKKNAFNKVNGKREQPGHYAAWALNKGSKGPKTKAPSIGRPSQSKLNAAAKAVR